MAKTDLSVITSQQTDEERDIGYDDVALRAVIRKSGGEAGTVRSATLHWSTPTAWEVGDEGRRVTGALQFHKAELPTDYEALVKVRNILDDLVTYLQGQLSEVAKTMAQSDSLAGDQHNREMNNLAAEMEANDSE
jgi:hypothetical protein